MKTFPMAIRRWPILLTVLLLLVGMAYAARAALAGYLAAAPAGCPDVLLIGARGSGEVDHGAEHGLGRPVNAFFTSLQSRLPQASVKSLAVIYTAADVKVLGLTGAEKVAAAVAVAGGPVALEAFLAVYHRGHLVPYLASLDEGIKSALDELNTEAGQCPATRFVLAGYSQGAMVMHQALLRLDDGHHDALAARIVATVLIADGDKKRETAATRFGTSDFTAQGIRSVLVVGERDVPSAFASTTFDICEAADLVCDFSPSGLLTDRAIKIHETSYTGQLVSNIAKRVGDLAILPPAPSPSARTIDICAAFVSDVTLPDGAEVSPGQNLTKTWRLRNCGSAPWKAAVAVRTDGDFGPAAIRLPDAAPNVIVEVSTPFSAPTGNGVHRSTYRPQGSDGALTDHPFWVEVTVRAPAEAAPTHRAPTQQATKPAQAPPPGTGQVPPPTDPGQLSIPPGAQEIGGIDLDRYCWDGWRLHAVLRFPVTWGWRCATSTVPAGGNRVGDQNIDTVDACAQQYGSRASSHYRRYDDPNSWYCWAP